MCAPRSAQSTHLIYSLTTLVALRDERRDRSPHTSSTPALPQAALRDESRSIINKGLYHSAQLFL